MVYLVQPQFIWKVLKFKMNHTSIWIENLLDSVKKSFKLKYKQAALFTNAKNHDKVIEIDLSTLKQIFCLIFSSWADSFSFPLFSHLKLICDFHLFVDCFMQTRMLSNGKSFAREVVAWRLRTKDPRLNCLNRISGNQESAKTLLSNCNEQEKVSLVAKVEKSSRKVFQCFEDHH